MIHSCRRPYRLCCGQVTPIILSIEKPLVAVGYEFPFCREEARNCLLHRHSRLAGGDRGPGLASWPAVFDKIRMSQPFAPVLFCSDTIQSIDAQVCTAAVVRWNGSSDQLVLFPGMTRALVNLDRTGPDRRWWLLAE